MINESYSDKIRIVKGFLDNNFMRAQELKNGDDGLKKNISIFVQLDPNHMPTDSKLYREDVLDILDHNFSSIVKDDEARRKFLLNIINDWYSNKISKYNSITKYNFQ